MSTRDTLARLALPLLGAVAVTAGAVIVQITRRPAPEADRAIPAGPGNAASAIEHTASPARFHRIDAPAGADDSFLQRLRESGI